MDIPFIVRMLHFEVVIYLRFEAESVRRNVLLISCTVRITNILRASMCDISNNSCMF